MKSPRLLAVGLALVALTVAPAPSGHSPAGCRSLVATTDLGLRASLDRFDQTQSAAASKICAAYLNTMVATLAPR